MSDRTGFLKTLTTSISDGSVVVLRAGQNQDGLKERGGEGSEKVTFFGLLDNSNLVKTTELLGRKLLGTFAIAIGTGKFRTVPFGTLPRRASMPSC